MQMLLCLYKKVLNCSASTEAQDLYTDSRNQGNAGSYAFLQIFCRHKAFVQVFLVFFLLHNSNFKIYTQMDVPIYCVP